MFSTRKRRGSPGRDGRFHSMRSHYPPGFYVSIFWGLHLHRRRSFFQRCNMIITPPPRPSLTSVSRGSPEGCATLFAKDAGSGPRVSTYVWLYIVYIGLSMFFIVCYQVYITVILTPIRGIRKVKVALAPGTLLKYRRNFIPHVQVRGSSPAS